jgi:hypothetical protein
MAMIIVFLVTAWALVEAIVTIAKATHATGRSARRNMFTGRFDLTT